MRSAFGLFDEEDDTDSAGGNSTDRDNYAAAILSNTGLWTVGGTGLSNGIASEQVSVLMYPRKANRQLLAITMVNLAVRVIANTATTTATITANTDGSYSASYTRPSIVGSYTLQILYQDPTTTPPTVIYQSSVPLQVTGSASTLTTNSLLDVGESCRAGVRCYATIIPKDNFVSFSMRVLSLPPTEGFANFW